MNTFRKISLRLILFLFYGDEESEDPDI